MSAQNYYNYICPFEMHNLSLSNLAKSQLFWFKNFFTENQN